MNSIGERIKEQRSNKGLSLDKLSKLSGVSKTYLSEIESGVKSNPSADVLLKIATALDVSLPYLLEGNKEDTQKNIPVPISLKEAAIEIDMKYSEVEQLQKHAGIALAHRGKKVEGNQISKDGWIKLYNTLKEQGLL